MAACDMTHHMDPSSAQVAGLDGAARSLLASGLRRDVEALTRHEDRRPGGRGHAAASAYLAGRLDELGLPSYTGDGYLAPFGGGLVNVLAAVHGADRHRRPLVLAANYDGVRGSPGAGANAASVALVLAVAQRLPVAALGRGVVVALLDHGAAPRHPDSATGATVLLGDQRRHDVKAAIVLDRLGHRIDGTGHGVVFVTGAETDARMPAALAGIAGERLAFVPVHRQRRKDVPLSAPFVTSRVPYLELCGGHWSEHGTRNDHADRIDIDVLVDLVAVIEALLRRLDVIRLPGPYEGYDTSAFEREALREARHLSLLAP